MLQIISWQLSAILVAIACGSYSKDSNKEWLVFLSIVAAVFFVVVVHVQTDALPSLNY